MTINDIMSELKTLLQDTNAAIKAAHGQQELFLGESIDWGNVNCIDTAHIATLYHEEYFMVLIENVRSDSVEFAKYIQNWLGPRWSLVEVRMLW